MEFYIELIDDDSSQPGEGNNELVDRFVIPINDKMSDGTYSGIFGLASIHLSVNVQYSEFYFGDNCDQLKPVTAMNSNPTSSPSGVLSESDAVTPLLVALFFVILFYCHSWNNSLCGHVWIFQEKNNATQN